MLGCFIQVPSKLLKSVCPTAKTSSFADLLLFCTASSSCIKGIFCFVFISTVVFHFCGVQTHTHTYHVKFNGCNFIVSRRCHVGLKTVFHRCIYHLSPHPIHLTQLQWSTRSSSTGKLQLSYVYQAMLHSTKILHQKKMLTFRSSITIHHFRTPKY